MGNCVHGGGGGGRVKAAVVEYPSGRHEFVTGGRVTAHQVMLQNPGFYVAKKTQSPSSTPSRASTFLKATSRRSARAAPSLLPADAPLCTGAHYRLLTFEEVFYQFARANRVEFMFSPRLRSSRRMPQTTANYQSQAKKRSILPFSNYHSSPPHAKKGATSKLGHTTHKSHF